MIDTEGNWPDDWPRFAPRPWLRNGHMQTIVGNFLPRSSSLPGAEAELVEITPAHGKQIATQILCECHWQPERLRAERLTVLILHGLEGSSRSQYVVGNAAKLWAAGCNIIRMNMRNCGPKEALADRLTPTLYHSGLSGDVAAVLRHFVAKYHLKALAMIGYSMGGNLVLKLAGELETVSIPEIRSVVGVSPAVDLAASADALHEVQNRVYEQKFLRGLIKRFRRKAMLFPRAFDPQMAAHITSLRQFDDRITALYCGFQSADDYYYRAAAARVLNRIAIPTMILHAADDPFVKLTRETRTVIQQNPNITMLESEHGGHCAFLATPDKQTGNDGYWAEHMAVRFILENP